MFKRAFEIPTLFVVLSFVGRFFFSGISQHSIIGIQIRDRTGRQDNFHSLTFHYLRQRGLM
jgi:hypothetical protein